MITDAHVFPYRGEIHVTEQVGNHENWNGYNQAVLNRFLVEFQSVGNDQSHTAECRVARCDRTTFVYTFDETKDIAWLYLVSDMMITDYSSVMFDYSLLKRPMLFFAYDLENYKENLRGFYFDFVEEAPGPISKNTDQLIQDIKTYDPSQWKEKYQAYSAKYNHVDDGHASEHIVDLIKKKSR